MKNNRISKQLFFVIAFLTLPLMMYAQDSGPGFPGGNGGGAPDGEVPIDGGASLLAGAAVAYGLKKAREKKRNDNK